MKDVSVLIQGDKVRKRIAEIAKQIKNEYKGNIYCVVVLTGAIVWFTDLMRELNKLKVNVEFAHIKLASYEGVGTKEDITIDLDIKKDILGKDVLVIEDIIDTGATMRFMKEYLKLRGAKRVKSACLLCKKNGRSKEVKSDYICFDAPNKFVVGYGLDLDQKYRDLDYIGFFD